MTDYDKVCDLVSKTGAGYAEAKYALEACGGDMTEALIMLEKSQKAKSNTNINKEDIKRCARNASDSLRRNCANAAGYAERTIRNHAHTTLKICGKREYLSIPLFAAIIIGVIFGEITVPAFIISLFCGIKYVLTGPNMEKDFVIGINKGGMDPSPSYDTSYTEPVKPAGYEVPKPRKENIVYTYESTEQGDNGFFN